MWFRDCCDPAIEEAHPDYHFSKHHLKMEQLPTLFTGGSDYLLEGTGNQN